MGISLFEIVGPVMIGPSSSHTAGMARIGRVAGQILPHAYKSVRLTLHPAIRHTYCGHRTDVALVGGLLGIREDDVAIRGALEQLKAGGVSLVTDFWTEADINPNTVRIETTAQDGSTASVTGISVGGGSIAVTDVNGFALSISPYEYTLLLFADRPCAVPEGAFSGAFASAVREGQPGSGCALTFAFRTEEDCEKAHAAASLLPGIRSACVIRPVLDYGSAETEPAPLASCEALLALCEKNAWRFPDAALDYESARSGRSRESIAARMRAQLALMRESCETGLRGDNPLNYGLTSGSDGKSLWEAVEAGRTLSGRMLGRACARAIATMEVNGSMGCVVASPTAGSCGILPGCFITAQEERGLSDDTLVDGLLTAALMGVIMHNRSVSFSGVVGGCQAEIGVSSAITAAGLACIAGGDGGQIAQAMALAVKNLLGLICDPIAGPVEVPCIKRNSVGVANAFAAADMALAGIESYIPPDEVIDALVNTEKLLPPALKGTTTGGLASTETACLLRKKLNQ